MLLRDCFVDSLRARRSILRLAIVCGCIAAAITSFKASAAVTAQGNVTPSPPSGGGNIAAPFFVGDTSFGSINITAGTPLTVTGGNSTWVGDDEGGVGILTASGFGSNFSAGADLHIGDAGIGSVSIDNLAQLSTTDDIILGEQAGSTGNLFVNALGSLVTVGDDIVVGQAGEGRVQITSGGKVTAKATVVGQAATADGTVTVSGNTSQWDSDELITIGDLGRGVFQIVSQARARTAAAVLGSGASGVGSAEVSGASSQWTIGGTLNLGVSGDGALRIASGGRATATGATILGNNANSEGRLEVSGSGSAFSTNSTMTIGNSGLGIFYLLAGARASSTAATLGDQAAGRAEVIVDGEGSVWEICGALQISDPGEARMTIGTSGRVTTTGGVTVGANGQLLFGGGRLEVGSGTLTNNGLVFGSGRIVGNFANSAAGQLRTDATSLMAINGALTNTGLVSMEGGQLQVSGVTTNNNDIEIRSSVARFLGGLNNTNGAQLSAVGGNVDVYGAVTNSAGGQILIGGGATAVFHDPVANNGQLTIMPGADALFLENLELSSGSTLALQLGPDELSLDLGQVEVGGTAALAGTLQVSLASGYAPQLGESFQLITAGAAVSGAFTSEVLPTLADGLQWELTYTADSLLLSVAPGDSADFNGDGTVNADDLAAWQGGFGTNGGATSSQGDANGDGDVDGADFLAWQRQIGAAPPAAPAVAGVPEPASALLGVLASALLMSARRRAA